MANYKITPHFTLAEFCENPREEYVGANYRLACHNIEKVTLLAEALEAIRTRFATPIIITSGVRCEGLNDIIKGSPASQHTKCEAVDFIMPGANLADVFAWIVISSGLKFGQAIFENAGGKCWVHYSLGEPYREPGKCREALLMQDGKYEIFMA